MPIIDLYRELRTLEPRLLELPGLVQSGEVNEALQVIGGNERLESVCRFLAQLRDRMDLRQDVPRALKLRIAVLSNSMATLDLRASSIFDFILGELDKRAVNYQLIAPGGDDPPYAAFLKYYPMASWRFVDWNKFGAIAGAEARQFNENEPLSMRERFRDCCRTFNIHDGSVFITTSIFEASLQMTVADLLEHSDALFEYCSDMLFIGENAAWIFEVFHEGEIAYGRRPLQ